ncbi:hypothetical protein [Lacticaseibacillus parakribbianus]|uniref:hypothetical protein n=1 Tax=Lacticaseibacillus parakribbianus TaxID=2970927 RepID=UPI0021CB1054|nr:hypothetical protein [Lacticaseibacillus parakribbianus]
METSDWVQTITSVVAVIIALGSLWWSVKIQHDANRPYVIAKLEPIRIHGYTFVYLVIENYGNTGADIRGFKASKNVVAYDEAPYNNNPFENVHQMLIAPGQTMKAGVAVNTHNPNRNSKISEFDLSFEWRAVGGNKWSKSTFHLDLEAALDMQVLYAAPDTTGRDVAKEVSKLTKIVAEVFRESTINHL